MNKTTKPGSMIAAVAMIGFCALMSSSAALAQKSFATPELAMQELVSAAREARKGFVVDLFGPQGMKLVSSGNEAEDRRRLERFNRDAAERATLLTAGADKRVLAIGIQEWPFPIPIVRRADRWSFDPVAGAREIEARLIGHNELQAIEACRAFIEAQKEYIRLDHDGDGLPEYAQRIISRPGQRDGLYWPTSQGAASPLSEMLPAAEKAAKQGASEYEGYNFRVLKAQGPKARGGAFSYVVNGQMIHGFALVAYPRAYGKTGVYSFICSHLNAIYERDLGPETQKIGAKLETFDPGPQWRRVVE